MSIFDLFTPNVEKLGNKRDVKGLLEALVYQKDSRVRRKSAETLGYIGDETVIWRPLCAALNDESGDVRTAASDALRRLKKGMVSVSFIARIPKNTPSQDLLFIEYSFNELNVEQIPLKCKGGIVEITLSVPQDTVIKYTYFRMPTDKRSNLNFKEQGELREAFVKWANDGSMVVHDTIEHWADEDAILINILGDITEELGCRIPDARAYEYLLKKFQGTIDCFYIDQRGKPSYPISSRAKDILATYGVDLSKFTSRYCQNGPMRCLQLIAYQILADVFSDDRALDELVSTLKYSKLDSDWSSGYRSLASNLLKTSRHPKASSFYVSDPDSELWVRDYDR